MTSAQVPPPAGRYGARERRRGGLLFVLSCLAVAMFPAFASPAAAHPLGDLTVNHYDGLRITPDRIENTAVVDSAELPTLQAVTEMDTDGSGRVSAAELAAYGAARCAALAGAQRLTVNGSPVAWRVAGSGLRYARGQGGLRTSRLTCDLTADVRARGTVDFSDDYLPDRTGWREITAVASGGLRLSRSSVPGTSVSGRLRSYPDDLLAAPLDQRTARLSVTPETGPSAAVPSPTPGPSDLSGLSGGPLGGVTAWLDHTFTGLVGTDSPTAPLVLLSVLMAVALGAGHALIPGHGKTIMAAYLAGRRGRPRDALIVGATVTVTHTVGVLVAGLLLTVLSALTGEAVLAWLGLVSGLLITLVGAGLLRSAWHAHRTGEAPAHGHGHGHTHGRAPVVPRRSPVREVPGGAAHGYAPVAVLERRAEEDLPREPTPRSRRGLVGLGVAGGLVPSPSALVVLLGAIGLGRTWFGIALILAYGLGMAGTLTLTGLLLVKLAGRLGRLAAGGNGVASRLSSLLPIGTAVAVMLLGLGLTVRSLIGAA
ncbi:High-affinity nickel-transporter [Streptosporangium sp. NPDC020072]|uniref:High-affinity nickel-transporter n=1 Tax=Streptosporangium sp. NPDC020072 TaxID=3154788 RepID=UPI003444E192